MPIYQFLWQARLPNHSEECMRHPRAATRNTFLGSLALLASFSTPAFALDLAGLSNRNELLLFSDTAPGKVKTLTITGVEGKLLGIDVRPADGKLYALAHDGAVYTIDTASGTASRKTKLSVSLETIDYLVVDFNPQADRMRVIGSSGQNLRANVDTGQTLVDGKLAYRPTDRNAGKPMGVYAGAYINSFAGATQTQLFEIDSLNGTYIVQDPPNDGVLRTVGPTGLKPGEIVEAIDIYTDASDNYVGFAVAGGKLYRFDVGTGKMGKARTIGNGKLSLIDIAVLTPRR
jgi:outer membrane protein assembly factor BamB